MTDFDDEQENELRKKDPVRWGEVVAFAWRYWRAQPGLLALCSTLLVVGTLCDSVIPFFSKKIIDSLANGHAGLAGQKEAAFIGVAGFFGFALLHHIIRVAGLFCYCKTSIRAMPMIVDRALFKISRLSTDWHINSFSGATVRKITRGMWAYDTFADTIFMGLAPAVVILVSVTAIQFVHWPMMGLIFGVGFMIYVVISALLAMRYLAPVAQAFNETDSALGAALADTITCNAVVKSFGAEAREEEFIRAKLGTFTSRFWRLIVHWANADMLQSILLTVMMGIIVGYAVWLWSVGRATPGDVTFAMSSCFILNSYIRDIGSKIRTLQRSINDMEDIVRFDRMALDIIDRKGAAKLSAPDGHVAFDRVTFGYANQKDDVYQDLSVRIAPGEKIGLVGHSGSGKSTFAKLLQRLYDIKGGRILIDGQDIAGVTQESLRHAISIVP